MTSTDIKTIELIAYSQQAKKRLNKLKHRFSRISDLCTAYSGKPRSRSALYVKASE
ncbi:MAG: hypothetical protein IKI05_08230 [Bacteroidaceae bacterium]|nr:hypothetical protein [Bacteroidaceae bacterium]